MTLLLEKGRYRARESVAAEDVLKAQSLRRRAFGCDDSDALDERCTHILVEDTQSGEVKCCYRMLALEGVEIEQSYSAQFYDLSNLAVSGKRLLEMGRFCTDPAVSRDPDLLRLAWGAMTLFADAQQIEMLFGCSSFAGTEAIRYAQSFALLNARFKAPEQLSPKMKAASVFSFDQVADVVVDPGKAMRAMPPLLRTYLTMGGWVSDHAVVDAKMNTLHVFTGVEIAAIPPVRKRLLRAIAG